MSRDDRCRPTRRWRRWVRVLTLAALLPALAAALAAGQAGPEPAVAVLRSGTLGFTGHATVGDFVGATTTVSGAFTGDVATARGWVEAPVATLVTHNEHRDRDLRASMDVAKYPAMRFDLESTTVLTVSRDSVAVLLRGTLRIHGVARAVALPATVVHEGGGIHLTSAFPLDLLDYRIGGLTKMLGLLRMQRRIEVRVDLRFEATPQDRGTTRGTSMQDVPPVAAEIPRAGSTTLTTRRAP